MKIYKYSGAGNDFVVIDGRAGADSAAVESFRSSAAIQALCSRTAGFKASDGRVGADGLMILGDSASCDFAMEYYNSDGSGGMMCGNGGRCMVAFAHELGVWTHDGSSNYVFEAADGLHTGQVLAVDGSVKTVKLKMTDVYECHPALDGWFLDTGTRHHVLFVPDVEKVDVDSKGRSLRWNPAFAPKGANVNFISMEDGVHRLKIRTFEKGVEAETLACGTGITASAIAAAAQEPGNAGCSCHYAVQARQVMLSVDFNFHQDALQAALVSTDGKATSPVADEVYLTGPAELICIGSI